MKSCNFEKCKFILSQLFAGRNISTKDTFLVDNDITEASAAKILTALNKASVIEKPDRERNKLKNTLINKQFFNNQEFNINIMASIISRVNENHSSDIMQYIFKKTPQNIYRSLSRTYSSTINNDLINFFDKEQYKYFSILCSAYPRVVCELDYGLPTLNISKMVPLRIFFYENEMYISFLQIKNKKIKNISSKDISSSLLLENDSFVEYIKEEDIDYEIDKFVMGFSNTNESITLWLTSGLLNHLAESNLIDRYEILGKKEFTSLKKETSISKRKSDQITKMIKEETKKGRVYFDYIENNVDKYKVRIFSDKYRLSLLVKQYIKKEDLIQYKSIKKHINSFCGDKGFIMRFMNVTVTLGIFLFWLSILVLISEK